MTRSVDLLLQDGGEVLPKPGMRLDEAGNVSQILYSLALTACRFRPRLDFPLQGIFERCNTHEDAVDIGGHGAGRIIAVEFLGAELDAHGGVSFEVDRPLELFRFKTFFAQKAHNALDSVRGYDQVDILSNHRLFRPVIDGDPADDAPWHIGPFENIDKCQYVVRSARGLPIVELLCSHLVKLMRIRFGFKLPVIFLGTTGIFVAICGLKGLAISAHDYGRRLSA